LGKLIPSIVCRCIDVIFFRPKGYSVINKYFVLLKMESVYHIVAIRVNETSWAHVWRLRFRYLGTEYDKKDQFKAYGEKRDIPRMEMVHHQDVTMELSTRLLAAQCEIKTLRIRLWNVDDTIRGYMRMVEGQASDLYASDTDTWLATSSV
jgi:hypothetical protein